MRAHPKPLACSAALRDRLAREVTVEGDPPEGGGPVGGVVAVDEQPAVTDRRREPADVGRDDGGAARLRLDRDEPEGLAVRRHGDDVGSPVPLGERGPVDRRHDPQQVRDAQPLGEVLQAHRDRARPSRSRRRGRRRRGGRGRSGRRRTSSAAARTRTSGPLSGWIRPTKRRSTASAGRPSSARAPRLRTGGERHEVDPGLGDGHAGGVGAVELDELGGLPRRCSRRAGRRPRRPGPPRSRGRGARARRRRRGGGS